MGYLYQLGSVQFDAVHVPLYDYDRETGGDLAPKDVIGGARPREFTGESDTRMVLAGQLFPGKFGGLDSFDRLEKMAQSGEPQFLVRGDGIVMGWFFIERVNSRGKYLNTEGVGRAIEFQVMLVKSPRGGNANTQFQQFQEIIGLFR